jgi:sugar lactone lactonase YvrE
VRTIVALSLVLTQAASAQSVRTLRTDASLGTPDGMAIGPDGSFYIADFGGGAGTRVLKVERNGRVSTFADGFQAPDGVAFDARGRLYVSSFNGGTIHRFERDGTRTTFASGLDHPSGMAFDGTGTLFVANFGNFNGTTVSRITPDGQVSEFATGFSAPLGIAIGPDGLVYVGNYGNGEIHRVRPDGTREPFASVPNAPLAQLQYLAFDSRGTLYVPSLGHHRVYAVDRQGTVRTFAGSGIAGSAGGPAQSARLHAPNSIAIRGDTVFVTEFPTGRIRMVEPATPAGRVAAEPSRPRLHPLSADSSTYVVTEFRGAARDSLGTVRWIRRQSGDTLEVVQRWETRQLRSTDTTLLHARDFRLLRRRSGPAERRTEIINRQREIRTIVRTPTRTDSIDTPLNDPGVHDAATIELLMAALPPGNAESVIPLFVPAQRGVIESSVLRRSRDGRLSVY